MFNTFCWYLNVLHLSWLAAILRFVLHIALRPFAMSKQYAATDVTSYHGWVDVPVFGVVAFICEDGTLQYRW